MIMWAYEIFIKIQKRVLADVTLKKIGEKLMRNNKALVKANLMYLQLEELIETCFQIFFEQHE